ncbi:MAG: redoxin domain-containing protein [Verrucomicrobiae bacterium]|nr:redoxin domain-containing protein [Verrucomicrobiae bacterium]NNJ86251.1 redoxin domain-containing protein [Akkermansiaceae bacterium]
MEIVVDESSVVGDANAMRQCVVIIWMIMTTLAMAESLDTVSLYRLENGEAKEFKLRDETTHVAFYFSASWCPPCRQTTPPLVEEYQRMLKQESMPVEMVLVGSDRSEEKMFSYMKKYRMTWPAVVFAKRGVVEKYAADGIPHMVLVERQSGEVVSFGTGDAGIEAVVTRMRDFSGITAEKPFQTGSFMSRYGVLIGVGASCVVILLVQKWRERRAAKNL